MSGAVLESVEESKKLGNALVRKSSYAQPSPWKSNEDFEKVREENLKSKTFLTK